MAPSWPAPRREVAIAMPLNAARVVLVGRGMVVEGEDIFELLLEGGCADWVARVVEGGSKEWKKKRHSNCRSSKEDEPSKVTDVRGSMDTKRRRLFNVVV